MKEIKSLSKALADLNSCQTAVDKIMAAESASAVRDIVRYENVSEVARRSNALSETSLAEMGMASALHKESLVEQAMRATASGQSLRDKTMGAASAASIRDITASCEAVSGAAKLADGLVGTSCLKSAAASAASIRDITASCEAVSGVAKLANELAGTSYLKIASALHRESLLEQAVKTAASSQSLWDKTVAAASASSIKDIAASYKEISGATKLVSTLSETSRLSLAGSGMASVRYKESSSQSLWDKTMVSMVTPSVIEKATDVLRNSRSIFLEESNYLAAMAESVSQLEFEEKFVTDNSYENPEIVAEVSELLATSPSGHSFIQKFRNSHPLVQQFIYFIFIQIIFSQINSISANLLTPHVELYLHEKNITQREQINKIKKLPLTVKNIDTNQLRFITGNNVRLRKSPSTNSEILDEMELGKIVTVLSKKRNWINVEYTYKDGTVITGWVFTIYTKRFKK